MNSKNQKILFAACAGYILGINPSVKVLTTESQKPALKEALSASKKLYEALSRDNLGNEELHDLLEVKSAAATRFREAFGVDWKF
jgi:hypothetical protein